ncbi:MAG: FmdB family transcriptional regulator [Deltaproteobacteria bacterium]|nr:FmdB family transcriptional regulator [Deltaproteobacteria bacterium]
MPLYDYLCLDCGKTSELLLTGSGDISQCTSCRSSNLKRLLSAPSSLTGAPRQSFPGAGDTACCGSTPGQAAGCSGPGSCCGHRH